MDRPPRLTLKPRKGGPASRLRTSVRGAGRPGVPDNAALDKVIQEALDLAKQRQASGQLDEARSLYAGVLELRPDQPDALLGLAQIAIQVGQSEIALAVLARAINAHPGVGLFHSEHATVLRQLHRLDEAIVGYRRATELLPDVPGSWNNLGAVLYERLHLGEARTAYERAITLAPEYAYAHFGLSQVAMMQGDLVRGHAEFEWRWRLPGYTSEGEAFFRTFWGGSDLTGRTILLHDEQGFGDTIQNVRYVPLVKARVGRVIVRCQPPLGRLLESVAGVDTVLSIPRGEPMPAFDVHAPLMSLPHLLGTTVATVPATVPYLSPTLDDTARWKARLGADRQFKVGLAWAGSRLHSNDSHRSLPISELSALALDGVTIYSLQKDGASAALATLPDGLNVTDLGPALRDFAETAAAISQLDLVITVDTAVGHLAGALGRPVWVLLSSVHDARWMTEREDSPWYPSLRLFRQQHGEGWARLLGRVREALEKRIQRR
jgi:Tfp pilus assembly protein PilF